MDKVFLKPAEMYCERTPTIIQTVLGSCISVCVYDKRQKIGGMNHYVLPYSHESDEHVFPCKYGSTAIRALLKKMKNFNCRPEDLTIKILGGASTISGIDNATGNVAQKNIEVARQTISEFKLKIVAENVGGSNGRKVEFNTQTGELKFKISQIKETKVEENLIKVLIVDDSKPVRLFLRKMIEEDKIFKVVGEAEHPFEAMEILKKNKVDVITLDLNMPKMDGVAYLKTYMTKSPIPTIIVTDYNVSSSGPVFEALASGAFDYMRKPHYDQMQEEGKHFREKLIAAANSNITMKLERNMRLEQTPMAKISSDNIISSVSAKANLLAIGASTGGTEAIKTMLKQFPPNIPPTVIVQHIPKEFSGPFAESLNNACPFTVKEAQNGDLLNENLVLVAPGGQQMKVVKQGLNYMIRLTDEPPVNRFKPSVDYLFHSLTDIRDRDIVAVILTGMGADGAKGLLALKNIGAETIAQNEETSVVYGMPKAAFDIGAANQVVSLYNMGAVVAKALRKVKSSKKVS